VDALPGEPKEAIIRRFNRAVQDAGLLREMSRRAHFEKPSDTKRHHLQKIQRRLKMQKLDDAGLLRTKKSKRKKRKEEAARKQRQQRGGQQNYE